MLSGWQYRKKITIQGSSGAGTNYQVLLKVGESSGASGYNFHLEGLSANFPSGENQGGDLRFCYSPDTEILTENGWVLLKDLVEKRIRIRVATLNPQTNKIEFHYPIDYQKLYFKGKLFHQKGRSIDLLVTPEHRMWVRKEWSARKKRKFEIIQARDLPRHYQLQVSADWDGIEKKWFILPEVERINGWRRKEFLSAKKILMDDWLKFFGFWLAEGSVFRDRNKYVVALQQKDIKILEFFQKLLKEWGFNPHLNREQLKVCNIQLYSYLYQFGHAENKFIPTEIKNLSKRQLEILFEWMVKGDGHKRGKNIIYFTISKQLADDVSEIALKLGYSCSLKIRKGGTLAFDKYKRKEGYVLSLTKRETIIVNKTDKREWVDYKGFVYDITVPNHIIYVRRNGKPVWSGNCSSDGSTLLDFWVEKVVGTSPNRTAYVWVEVSEDLGTNKDIYIYFGNLSATNASNGSNTFIFFDDFDSFNSSNWDATGITYGVSNSIINFQSSSSYSSCLTYKVSTFSNLRTRCLVACSGTLPGIGNIITKANSTANSFISLYLGRIDNNGNLGSIVYVNSSGNWTNLTNQTKTITDGTYYVVDFCKYNTNLLINIYNPDYSVLLNSSTTHSALSSGYCGMWSPWSNKTQYADWFFVSKYISPEPAFSSAGALETLLSANRRRLLLSM